LNDRTKTHVDVPDAAESAVKGVNGGRSGFFFLFLNFSFCKSKTAHLCIAPQCRAFKAVKLFLSLKIFFPTIPQKILRRNIQTSFVCEKQTKPKWFLLFLFS